MTGRQSDSLLWRRVYYVSDSNTKARRVRNGRDVAPLHRVADLEPPSGHAADTVATCQINHSSQSLSGIVVSRKSFHHSARVAADERQAYGPAQSMGYAGDDRRGIASC